MNGKKVIVGLVLVMTITILQQLHSITNSSNKDNIISSLGMDILQSTVPSNSENKTATLKPPSLISKNKSILFWGTFYGASDLKDYCIEANSMDFCPFKCDYSVDQSLFNSSDAIVIHGREQIEMKFPPFRNPSQRWVYLMFESPDNSWTNISNWNNIFNWTMSYRSDSDLPIPYGKFSRIPKSKLLKHVKKSTLPNLLSISNKKSIAWAASNCAIVSSGRRQLVDEISKYIPVDVYGNCGQYICVKQHSTTSDQCSNPFKCHEFLGSQYKFYLAFENSLCQEYITEKFFNSFKYGMVPIVYGPSKEFYLSVAPKGSFIHIDDFASMKQLAEHLHFLDMNPKEYLKYFEWRKYYTLDNVYYFQRAWCSLCEKLHKVPDENISVYSNIQDWWFYKNDPIVQGKPCHKPNITVVKL